MVELARTYPMPPHVIVLRFVVTLLTRTAIVCGALSLLVVVLGLAIEEGALNLEPEVARGFDEYFRTFMGVAALGGGFGFAIVAAVVHDLYRREQRRALDRLADEGARRLEVPVEWQRLALEGSGLGTKILSGFAIVLGPIVILTAVIMLFDGDDVPFTLGALALGVVMSWVGFLGIRTMLRDRRHPAGELWGKRLPPLHPLEPPRRYDSDGNLQRVSSRELANAEAAKAELASAPPRVRDLAGLDRLAGRVMTVALVLFVVAGLLTSAMVLLRKPCRVCDTRTFEPGTETFIDVALWLATAATGFGLAVLILATVVEVAVTLQLRRTILELAADPASAAPPWHLLRRLLLEEAPLQQVTGHLHTVAVTSLALGLTGLATADTYPFSEWTAAFRLLATVGGILILFHASGWFWARDSTLAQNEALRERWSD